MISPNQALQWLSARGKGRETPPQEQRSGASGGPTGIGAMRGLTDRLEAHSVRGTDPCTGGS